MTKCEFCGKELKNPGPLRKFCRSKCRQRAYYKRLESNTINDKGELIRPIRFNPMKHCHNPHCRADNSNNERWFDAFIRKSIKPQTKQDIEQSMNCSIHDLVPKDISDKVREKHNLSVFFYGDFYRIVYCRFCLMEHYVSKI
jgi:hypothetical protein